MRATLICLRDQEEVVLVPIPITTLPNLGLVYQRITRPKTIQGDLRKELDRDQVMVALRPESGPTMVVTTRHRELTRSMTNLISR